MIRFIAIALFMLCASVVASTADSRCRLGEDVPERIALEGVYVIVLREPQCFGVYENGKLSVRGVGQYLFGYASTGKAGKETPFSDPAVGPSRIFHADRNKISSIYKMPMPCALFFNGDIALHAGSDLRPYRSNGCVRLPKRAACALFDRFRHSDIKVIVVSGKEDLRSWK